MQTTLLLFCGRFASVPIMHPSAPDISYALVTGSAPEWASAANFTAEDAQVYFELDVIFSDPILALEAANVLVEAGNAISQTFPGFILDVKHISNI